MAQIPHFQIFFTIGAVIWVGGWGLLMFRYPEFFAKINSRLGMKAFATPKYISFIKKLGILEMVLAALSVLNALIMHALGIKGF